MCVFVRKKSIKSFLTSNCCFRLKHESSESGKKYAQIKHFYKQNNSNQFLTNMLMDLDVREQQGIDFFQVTVLWIMDWCFDLTLKNILMINVFIINPAFHFTRHVNWCTGVVCITCRLLWCVYQLFGFWRHPFTAEDPLVSKWSNAKFPQICFDEETNSSI